MDTGLRPEHEQQLRAEHGCVLWHIQVREAVGNEIKRRSISSAKYNKLGPFAWRVHVLHVCELESLRGAAEVGGMVASGVSKGVMRVQCQRAPFYRKTDRSRSS